MKITVVIPVYNTENHLLRAINSVLSQPEVAELILVEDGSSDNSLQLCLQQAALDTRILVLQHPGNKNKGVSATRNLGIKNSKGPYIAFLDGDDYYLPGRFKQTKKSFAADNSIEGVYEMIGLHSDSKEIKRFKDIALVSPGELFENLQPIGEKVWFQIDGLTVKKSIFDKSGFFDESLKTSEDTLQWFKMASVAKLVAGNILHPVGMADRRIDSLSADKKLVERDFVLMLFKLFQWCKKTNCKKSRKELVMKSLFYHSANPPFRLTRKGMNKIYLLLKVLITDPEYVLLRSSEFGRHAGNIFGYGHANRFFGKYKLSK